MISLSQTSYFILIASLHGIPHTYIFLIIIFSTPCSNPNIASEGDGGSTTESSELEWPQYTLTDPVYRELSINMKTGRGLKAKQCTLWNDYLPKLEAETAAKGKGLLISCSGRAGWVWKELSNKLPIGKPDLDVF